MYSTATEGIHFNKDGTTNYGWRKFNHTKLTGTGGTEQIMSFTLTSAPSYNSTVQFLVYFFSSQYPVNNNQQATSLFNYEWTAYSSQTWESFSSGNIYSKGNTIAQTQMGYGTSGTIYIGGYGNAGASAYIGCHVQANCSIWDKISITYY
jgi:hypothetical protein